MKRQYRTPEIKVVNVDNTDIICASVGFGEETTGTMNAREFDFDNGLDDLGEDLLWDE